MRCIEIKGNTSLKGTVNIPGSKNSALGLLAAVCLSNEEVTLKNIPDISDIELLLKIGEGIGLKYAKTKEAIIINPSEIFSGEIDKEMSAEYRASYYFIGSLLLKQKRVTIGYPGGDDFGSRPIDQHIKGFEALGAKVSLFRDYYEVSCTELKGNDIYFDVITCGATINVMLAATLATGRTVLRNAARDPEVVDVAIMLNKMGVKIKGMGTSTITIDGVESLSGCKHSVIPDRLIAGSLMIGAAATRGDVKVVGVIPEHLISCIAKLSEAGVTIQIEDDSIRTYVEGRLRGINVTTSMYPGFATDLQQPLTALLLAAESHSVIVDGVYPKRFNHCIEMNKMGANIILKEGSVVIKGKRKIHGDVVHATDVRAGVSLIIAAMMANGTTYITGIEHIERGYPNFIDTFLSLGAKIRVCEEILEDECSIESDEFLEVEY
ncbi:MAG: UDP-N-acetylglucosamine 1-carboxyvinyltransferase [Clostridium sp.]